MKTVVYRGILRLATVCLLIFMGIYTCNVIAGKGKMFDPANNAEIESNFSIVGKVYGIEKVNKDIEKRYILEGASVILYDKDYHQITSLQTRSDGEYIINLEGDSHYIIMVVKDGYQSRRIYAKTEKYGKNETLQYDFDLRLVETQHQAKVNQYLEYLAANKKDIAKPKNALMASNKSENKRIAESQYSAQEEPVNNVVLKEEVLTNIVFKIQLGVFSRPLDPGHFSKLKNVKYEKNNGYYIYSVGDFYSIEMAQKVKQEIVTKGFRDVFIKAFYKGDPISVSLVLKRR